MRTRTQRANLAIICTTATFQMFIEPSNRGPNWTIDMMPKFIKGSIETQAFLYNIPEKHYEVMVMDGMEFYNRYLKSVLKFALKMDDV